MVKFQNEGSIKIYCSREMISRRKELSSHGFFFYWLIFTIIYLSDCKRIVKPIKSTGDIESAEGDDQNVSLPFRFHLRRNLVSPFRQNIDAKDFKQHKVQILPGFKGSLDFAHYAGHIIADENQHHRIFYWLIESPKDAEKKPLVIWLNGGPGCSSMDGLWLELGPFRLNEDRQTIKLNPSSWHLAANMLFIDQPVGTGFSFTKLKNGYPKNDEMINKQFYPFLLKFLELHSRYYLNPHQDKPYKTSRPIYFTGESHAGHFIPSIVQYILKANDEVIHSPKADSVFIDIAGIALGNPWIDPPNQYNPAEFAHGLGLLSKGQVNRLKDQEMKCRRLLEKGLYYSNICMDLLDRVLDSVAIAGHQKLLMYDVRKFLQNPNVFPPGHEALEQYLNRKEVKSALHVTETPHKFQECTDPPYFALSHQDGKGVMNEIRFILERNIDFLIFNGQYDLICNHVNIEMSLDAFNWTGKRDWLTARPGIWSVNKRPAGYLRKAKSLQTLLVFDAGHMVPMDVPEIALNIITTFIEKRSFQTAESRLGVKAPQIQRQLSSLMENLGEKASEASSSSSTTTVASTPSTPVTRSDSRPITFPIITMATPLQSGVYLRLRLQSLSRPHSKDSSHSSSSALSYYLRVEPGAKVIKIEESWFAVSQYTADVIVEQLVPGIEYSFVIQQEAPTPSTAATATATSPTSRHHPHHHHSFVSRRVMVTKPGCYSAKASQCCHRGECSLREDESNSQPYCLCDTGYFGEQCEFYQIASTAAATAASVSTSSSASSSLSSRILLAAAATPVTSNLTTTVTASCPSRVFPPSSAISLPLSSFAMAEDLGLEGIKQKSSRPCSITSIAKCCIGIELLIKFLAEMTQVPPRQLESMLSADVNTAVSTIVGFKQLVVADVVLDSESSPTKLLKGGSAAGRKGGHHSNMISHQLDSANLTVSPQMPLTVSMCGSPSLVNKVFREFEALVKDPTSVLNQAISWRFNAHYYRLLHQKSLSHQEMASYRGAGAGAASTSSHSHNHGSNNRMPGNRGKALHGMA